MRHRAGPRHERLGALAPASISCASAAPCSGARSGGSPTTGWSTTTCATWSSARRPTSPRSPDAAHLTAHPPRPRTGTGWSRSLPSAWSCSSSRRSAASPPTAWRCSPTPGTCSRTSSGIGLALLAIWFAGRAPTRGPQLRLPAPGDLRRGRQRRAPVRGRRVHPLRGLAATVGATRGRVRPDARRRAPRPGAQTPSRCTCSATPRRPA